MKPIFERMMVGSAMTLASDVIPQIKEGSYAAGNSGMIAGLLFMMSQEVDRAADRLIRENIAMRALFDRVSGENILPQLLRGKLIAGSKLIESSYKISDLEACNAELNGVLIVLHEFVETSAQPWAAKVNAEIWTMLEKSAEERSLVFPDLS